MNKLIIHTRFPRTVASLLKERDLIDALRTACPTEGLEVPYPDDALSQSLDLMLKIMEVCTLISDYKLWHQWEIDQQMERGTWQREEQP